MCRRRITDIRHKINYFCRRYVNLLAESRRIILLTNKVTYLPSNYVGQFLTDFNMKATIIMLISIYLLTNIQNNQEHITK